VYNLNYTPTALGVQSRREITSGGTRTKRVEDHRSGGCSSLDVSEPYGPLRPVPGTGFFFYFDAILTTNGEYILMDTPRLTGQ
jgi:hypothetical protein